MKNRIVMLAIIAFVSLSRRVERRFDRWLKAPRKDMFREVPGICPACGSAKGECAIFLPYYKVHRFMWGGGASQYLSIVPSKFWQAKFELFVCENCGLRYVDESYQGLTEAVEVHPLYFRSMIKKWTETFHPHLGQGDIDLFKGEVIAEQLPAPLSTYRKLYNVMLPHLKERGSFIDVGCNVGTFPEMVRNANPDTEVFACEINQQYLSIGKARYPKLNWIENKIGEGSSARKYDFVFVSHVIEHIWDLDLFFRSLGGILAPEGRMMLTTPNPECKNALMKGVDWSGYLLPHHCQLFTKASMAALLSRHGFEIVESDGCKEEHWFVCKRAIKP